MLLCVHLRVYVSAFVRVCESVELLQRLSLTEAVPYISMIAQNTLLLITSIKYRFKIQ